MSDKKGISSSTLLKLPTLLRKHESGLVIALDNHKFVECLTNMNGGKASEYDNQ